MPGVAASICGLITGPECERDFEAAVNCRECLEARAERGCSPRPSFQTSWFVIISYIPYFQNLVFLISYSSEK